MAERRGFEPPISCYTYNGLANRRLRPLGHRSTRSKYTKPALIGFVACPARCVFIADIDVLSSLEATFCCANFHQHGACLARRPDHKSANDADQGAKSLNEQVTLFLDGVRSS